MDFGSDKIYFGNKNPKFSFPTLWMKIQKLEVGTNHILLYIMNYESEIIINDKISMISWMRLKVINRTSLFINHSSATRSVDHISLPPQLGGTSRPWLTLYYCILYLILKWIKYMLCDKVSMAALEVGVKSKVGGPKIWRLDGLINIYWIFRFR